MVCPKCGSDKVNVQMVQKGTKSSTYQKVRIVLILFTLGLAWLFLPKTRGTKSVNEKTGICSACGNSWKIKD